ncbi:RsmD family RNA methyltransferase, partial [Inquilinus limosus]|uniref:RsmD family RNA methyltransferase n=1 Tax=Inquilinus limosus TaxID=171674 RepID=UPI001269EF5D
YGPDEGDAITGAVVLDAFAGTGALAFEALSRGAAEAWLFDSSAAALGFARKNAETLGETTRAHLLRADALKPPPARAQATLLFLDPPYRQGLTRPGDPGAWPPPAGWRPAAWWWPRPRPTSRRCPAWPCWTSAATASPASASAGWRTRSWVTGPPPR